MNITPLGIWGGYPKANSATSSFLIEEDGFHLLFDCGSGVLASLQNFLPIQKLDAVILTHYHHDHIADVGPLHFAKLIQNQLSESPSTLPIYAHTEDEKFHTLTYKHHTQGRDITTSQKIGPFSIQTIRTNHPVYCLAVRLESSGKSVIFTADTGWEESLISFSKGADLLVSEANLYEAYEGKIPGHMSGREAGLLADKARAERLLLTHLPHFGDTNELISEAKKHFQKPVNLAEVGRKYGI